MKFEEIFFYLRFVRTLNDNNSMPEEVIVTLIASETDIWHLEVVLTFENHVQDRLEPFRKITGPVSEAEHLTEFLFSLRKLPTQSNLIYSTLFL